jgi:hypothetical protein
MNNIIALNFRIWDDERTTKLRQMWWNGVSAYEIAVILGVTPRALRHKVERCGFTRNPLLKLMKKQVVEIGDPGNEPEPAKHTDGEFVTVRNVHRSECQWIKGEPGLDAVMCGQPVARGRYCEHHAVRAYAPQRDYR